jgi:hypothetical protein
VSENESTDWDPAEVIASNIVKSREVWKVLQEKGVTTETELKLDFFYDPAGREQDEELVQFLRRETDYEVDTTSDIYGVTGSTLPTTVSPEILDQWIEWMVLAGYENGGCRFDGWGLKSPD